MGRDGISVVEKAAAIIERFLDERATSLGFNEILAGTSLSRATVHRVLADMTNHGLLAQDSQRDHYRLGPLLMSIGALALERTGVAERAAPKMELLRDQFGETMVLAELQGDAVVPLQRIDGLHEMRMNQEIGRRYPAYAGATGKVLLAHLDSAALTTYLANTRIEQLTDRTTRRVEDLRLALERIRRTGVTVSRGERVPDAIAISAPVFDGYGNVACAITISGVASRWDRDRMFIGAQALKDASVAVSRELGHHPGAGEPTAEALRDPASEAYRLLSDMCDETWAGEVTELAGTR
jgi:DNA-binding IclR family transcriptional regulator